MEGNGVVFDHGLISMLEGACSASSVCWVLWKPWGRGDMEQSTADAWRGNLMCKPEQMSAEMQSKQRPHLPQEKQRDTLHSSCRNSKKAFQGHHDTICDPGGR